MPRVCLFIADSPRATMFGIAGMGRPAPRAYASCSSCTVSASPITQMACPMYASGFCIIAKATCPMSSAAC